MARRSKRYREARDGIDRSKRYSIPEAIEALRSLPATKFNATVELAVKLGVDPKQSDQIVRGSVSLPKGIGKEMRVIVFAEGAPAEAAKEAGASEAAGDELIEKIQGGWMDFDVAIATPDMMRKVGKLGRILGPQGKMPSPKSGTVTAEVAQAVREFRAGRIEYRTDQGGNVHVPVGKIAAESADLQANIEAFLDHIISAKPASAKGTYLQSVHVSASMSPALKLAV